jgi:hypothetical protein
MFLILNRSGNCYRVRKILIACVAFWESSLLSAMQPCIPVLNVYLYFSDMKSITHLSIFTYPPFKTFSVQDSDPLLLKETSSEGFLCVCLYSKICCFSFKNSVCVSAIVTVQKEQSPSKSFISLKLCVCLLNLNCPSTYHFGQLSILTEPSINNPIMSHSSSNSSY